MATPTLTTRGTPCAPAWDPEWIARVQALEDKFDRRVCGARTPTLDPCTIKSCHPSGRCRFPGGADLDPAQSPPQDDSSHGLYARGLRPCGPSCPLWDKCPIAGDDVEELQAPQRPTCPYETHDYQTAVHNFTQLLNPPPVLPDEYNPDLDILPEDNDHLCPEPPAYLVDLAHRVATVHVMVNRAAAALRETDVIDRTTIRSEHYSTSYALGAFEGHWPESAVPVLPSPDPLRIVAPAPKVSPTLLPLPRGPGGCTLLPLPRGPGGCPLLKPVA